MNFQYLVIFLIISSPLKFSLCQNDANSYFKIADSLYTEKEYEKSLHIYEKALHLFQELGNIREEQNSALEIAYCLNKLRNSDKNIKWLKKWIPIFEKENGLENLDNAKAYILLSLAYKRSELYNQALKSYNKAIDIYESNNTNSPNTALAYLNAAQIYIRHLNYGNSILYLEKALKKDSTQKRISSIHIQLAHSYYHSGNLDKAFQYYELGLKTTNRPNEKAAINTIGAAIYAKWSMNDKALELLNKTLDISKSTQYSFTDLLRLKNAISEIFIEENKLNLAANNYNKTIQELKIKNPIKSREIARFFCEVGNFYNYELNNLDKALSYYQQALIQVFPNFNSTDINDNPKIEDIYTESWIMTASARKGEALLARYNFNKDVNDLKNAAECFDLSIAGIKALINSYGTDNAKLYLGDYSHGHIENAMEVNYLLFKETGEKEYLEKIFSIMEKSKASVLEEALQKNRALILSGIPDSLLEKEKEIRLELSDINMSIKKEELYEAEADEEYISERRSRVVSRQREYEAMLEGLKNKYPAFNNYMEGSVTPTILEMQNYLIKNNETLIEYFIGEKNIYLIKINPQKAEVWQLPHTDFWDDQVSDFQDYFRNSTAIINDPRGYYVAAENFYQLVFPFDSLEEKIILVPDGQLNFIPFDALVKEQPEKTNFTEVDFLIKTHLIRYAYSAGLLLQPAAAKKKRGELLRIAPAFADGERGLAALDARMDKESLPFTTLSGEAATLSAFRQVAGRYRLVEFFTHAGADASDVAPHIEFIDTALYLPELYAMDIPAELVVLSACETGLGKFEKGEGVMSLARGFAYSGATDLVASLWRVNESSTASIVDYFYQYLMSGETKSASLRQAKLQYFENAKSESKLSPYYWAGFVSIGPDGAMDFSGRPLVHWWIVVMVAVVVMLGQLLRRRKKRKKFS